MALARKKWLMEHPNRLDDGANEVLLMLGPDLTARQWARRLGYNIIDIERACAWTGASVRPAGPK
jgi:hypothetical protein